MKYTLVLFLIVQTLTSNAQPLIAWKKAYGGTNGQQLYDIKSTPDGGYILLGETGDTNGDVRGKYYGKNDMWVVKLDKNRDIQWQRIVGGTKDETNYSIEISRDGRGYVIGGGTESNDGDITPLSHGGYGDLWIIKLNNDGTTAWQKLYGGSGTEHSGRMAQTSDSGFILGSYTNSSNGDISKQYGSLDIWILKLDKSGNKQWEKSYGGTKVDQCHAIRQTTDGGYIVAGYTFSSDNDVSVNKGSGDMWVFKLDGTGTIQWEKTYGGTSFDAALDIRQTTDGGYIVAGQTLSNDGDVSGLHYNSADPNDGDMWVVKLDAAGTMMWEKALGGTDYEMAYVVAESGSTYLIGGKTNSKDGDVKSRHPASPGGNYPPSDNWLVALDAGGNILWEKAMGSTGDEWGFKAIIPGDENNFVVAGNLNGSTLDGAGSGYKGINGPNFWVIKFGNSTGINGIDVDSKIKLYPNPICDELVIENAADTKLQVFDMVGKEVCSATLIKDKETINIKSLPSGSYLCRVTDNAGNSVVRKIVRQ